MPSFGTINSLEANREELKVLANKEVRLEKKLRNMPSMQTMKEKEFLYKLALEYYKGQGLIFDAGLYLGVSTLCFGRGLKKNPHIDLKKMLQKPIQSFELGICTPGIAKKINQKYPDILQMKEGDSFLPILRSNIKEVKSLTRLYEGDISDWLQKIPEALYEIVFLDVLKIASVNDSVVSNIFPSLIPGRSVVIQQDFLTTNLPWIQISMGYLKEYFEYLFTRSASTIYLNTKKIPKELVSKKFYDDFTLEESLELFAQSYPFDLDEFGQYKMELAKGLLIAYKSDINQGIKHLEGCRSHYEKVALIKPWIRSVDDQIDYARLLNLRLLNLSLETSASS